MAKNSIDVYGASGKTNVLSFNPEALHLVDDPSHLLYDERIHLPLKESTVLNIMKLGVIEPIAVWKDSETGKVYVVFGRQRVKHVIEANRRLVEMGKEPLLIPGVVKRGTLIQMAQLMVSENEIRQEAYNLDTQAQNTAMSVQDFTRLAGAMRILGSDSDSAATSIDSIFKTLNEAASGKNAGALAALAQIGAQIDKNNDGSVNTLKTLESIANIFPRLRPDQQKSFADAMGLTPDMLTLMREGVRYSSLLAKADKLGLTVDPTLNKQLSDVNVTMNELGAAWDGLINKAEKKALKFTISDGSVKDGLEGITDLFSNGDLTGLSHALGFVSSDDADKLRRIQGNKDLYNKLSRRERGAVDAGFTTCSIPGPK